MIKKLIVILGVMLILVACNRNETIKDTIKETETETVKETETEKETERETQTKKETEKETEIESNKDTQSEGEFVNPVSDQFTINDFKKKEDYVIYKLKQTTGLKDIAAIPTGNEVNINGINAEEFQVYEDKAEHIVTYGYYAVDNAGIIYENDIITNQWVEVK